ncbi:SRPBCC family protein [Glaciibacter sp. 2TAF33]|uniref:SRPBCC family protein n=1 Tax=Glaciibacter sp. 2TAF33 TaxID=3233015 RepID=UPI003F92CBB7
MTIVEVSGEIEASPSAVWAVVGDFGGVAAWNPFVASAEIAGDGIGMTRTITAQGGARIAETLEDRDADEWHLRYSVQTEAGALSTVDIRLGHNGPDRTIVLWQSIRDGDMSSEQQDAISTTLQSRIEALAHAVSTR